MTVSLKGAFTSVAIVGAALLSTSCGNLPVHYPNPEAIANSYGYHHLNDNYHNNDGQIYDGNAMPQPGRYHRAREMDNLLFGQPTDLNDPGTFINPMLRGQPPYELRQPYYGPYQLRR